ncbi:MAG: HD domain-containing protein [bacterium]
MNKNLEKKLTEKYKSVFINSFEAGGGYGFRYYHGLRTMIYCKNILKIDFFKNKKINQDATLIAALFSDIGKLESINKKGELIYKSKANNNHAEIGGKIVEKYLSGIIKDKKLIYFISSIISEQHLKQQTSIESKIVKDLDRLDNYGFIQIWRHITYAHYDKRNIDRLGEFWFQEEANLKAKEYLNKFNFSVIKKIAKRRFKKLDYLIKEIVRESNGQDI